MLSSEQKFESGKNSPTSIKKISFFKNHPDLLFEWNSASQLDWLKIRRNFISAYVSAYGNCSLNELMFENERIVNATNKWNLAFKGEFENLYHLIIKDLQFYQNHETNPLEEECGKLKKFFAGELVDISQVREKIIKLIMLVDYFKQDFIEEKEKIESKSKKINYLLARFHDHPVAFFSCELNRKSGRVYLRFVTISPTYHGKGLGKLILKEIVKRYPDAIGMELYTRKANKSAIKFYQSCGFRATTQFDFEEPVLSLEKKIDKLSFPEDDATNNPSAFVGFSRQSK